MPTPAPHQYEAVQGYGVCCTLPERNAIHLKPVALPSLPYVGTSGWSGTDTSRARALHADRTGKTVARQRAVLAYLAQMGRHGATVHEVDEALGWHHHGTTSGALSNLHKAPDSPIEMLEETRNRCKVYVLATYVDGRPTITQGRKAAKRTDAETRALVTVEENLRTAVTPDAHEIARLCAALRRLTT